MSFKNVIWQITEVFLFLKQYYGAQSLINGVRVRLTLDGTANRSLMSSNFDVLIREGLISREPRIVLEEDIKMNELTGSCEHIANRFARRIFLLFGWDDISEATVTNWQKNLTSGQF